jgi:hypothetical protein
MTLKFNITEDCANIMNLIIKNDCQIYTEKQTETTKNVFKEFYNHFVDAEEFLKTIEIIPDVKKVEIKTKKTGIIKQFNKSDDHNYIIKPIREYINEFAEYDITYSLKLHGKTINIFFITDEDYKIQEIKRNIYRIILWLHTIIKYAKNTFCSKELNVYIFLTKLKKNLPENEKEEIGKINVNTGFTMTCQEKSNIVIYRKEEWYKVFVHETMHNLDLDFSGMDNDNTRKFILKIFPVNSDVKLYEAYTDAWAKILNVLLTSYLTSDRRYENFRINTQKYMNLERTHCFFQCIKILHHMGLTYENLYSKDEESSKLRKLYKEQTSILSYYIINAVILNIYQDFLVWCKKNNTSDSILQFVNIEKKQMEFCDFIEKNYKTKNMLNRIDCISEMFEHYKDTNTKKEINYLLKNMRKSLMAIQ